jgi:FAD/FMN-containing dehydrogenase
MVVGAMMLPPTATEAEVGHALRPWREVAALGAGCYIGFQGSATPEDVATAYPRSTRLRLAAVKRAYDPTNVFRHNHNIVPLTGRGAG